MSLTSSNIKHNKTQNCIQCVSKNTTGIKSKNRKGYQLISGHIWSKIKKTAKIRGHEFNINIKYIYDLFETQNRKCALTDLPLYFAQNHHETKSRLTTASLDRIDSLKGYIEGNVWWIHKDINWMKQDYTREEFINYCKMVAHKHGKNSES